MTRNETPSSGSKVTKSPSKRWCSPSNWIGTSLEIERLLATTELVLGSLESAYRRLSHVIEETPLESDQDFINQFFSRKLRGKVACLQVEADRRAANNRAQTRLTSSTRAQDDVDFCLRLPQPKTCRRRSSNQRVLRSPRSGQDNVEPR